MGTASRRRQCEHALAPLGDLHGIRGPGFLLRVGAFAGQHIVLYAAENLMSLEGREADTVQLGTTVVISYEATLQGEALDRALFTQGARLLLRHMAATTQTSIPPAPASSKVVGQPLLAWTTDHHPQSERLSDCDAEALTSMLGALRDAHRGTVGDHGVGVEALPQLA